MLKNSQNKSKEDVISYWNKRPCNSGHSDAPVGSKRFHEQVAQKRYLVEPHILDFADFHAYVGKNVLEIGSGIGTDAFQFVKSGAIVKSGDISHRSIEICEKIKESLEAEKIEFFCHDFENSKLPIDPQFVPDLIYSFGVIHHSPDPEKVFQNLSHWGKPGTKVKIMVYSRFSTKALALYLKYGYKVGFDFDKAVALQSEAQYGSPYTYTYTGKKIRKILENNNIQVTNIFKRHIFAFKVEEYKANNYVKKFYWRIVPKSLFTKVETILGWHLLIEGEVL